MQIHYKNNQLEKVLIGIKVITSAIVVASFVMLFGFYEPIVPTWILLNVQITLLCVFIVGKVIRFFNAESTKEYLLANWYEFPLLIALGVIIFGSGRWFGMFEPGKVRQLAVGIYLVIEVVTKICITSVTLAASGKNPTKTLLVSFLVLIIAGAGLLALPRSSVESVKISPIDALFTATSATCVTGLIVRDTGKDFSQMGQIIILGLIQLGGLGIVVFGAVIALLLGQAGLREKVAMQDLLSASTLGRISNMIVFIFAWTMLIEAAGAVSIFGMWHDVPGRVGDVNQQWFYSIFHSISAFCNAGFGLFGDSFVGYNKSWQLYAVICPLMIFGGLGFGVLYNLVSVAFDRTKRFFKKLFSKKHRFSMEAPRRMQLQTKIVLSVSVILIVLGTLGILLSEHYTGDGSIGIAGAFFQSISARTTGFNTVDISAMSAQSKFVLILLMFIGGSPGSTAGGIKTVTLAVIVMAVFATLRKRHEVEMFKRSVGMAVIGRAVTVTLVFVVVLFVTVMALSITERGCGFTMSDIFFESASALGTVGLTAGITPSLTAAGKLIIIAVMLIGRLGPLTLLAALTFNLKPARYNYPQEAVIVG
ncbi:MAG: potassium transporter TrkG [Phycisphaerae bacterium]|jgi:trk system potassium uptake protein TrkH